MEAVDKMYYDREYLKNMQKGEKDKFIKNFINKLVSDLHNPELANDEYVYHLYSDGSRTYTKGGRGIYGGRSIFIIESACMPSKTFFKFPIAFTDDSYAILTADQCGSIRNLMIEMMA